MDRKTIEVFLAMGVNPNATQKAISEFKKIKAQVDVLERDAANLKKAIDAALAVGEDASGLIAELKSVQGVTQKLRQQIDVNLRQGIRTTFEEAEAAAKKYHETLSKTREAAEKLEGISIRVGAVGLGILQGYQQLGQAYAEKAGSATEASQRWLNTSNALEKSQMRLGAVAANALNPMREKLAQAVEAVTSIAEKSPGAAQAIAMLGAGLAGLGGAGGVLSQGLRIYTDTKMLAAAALQKTAADEMLTAAGIQNTAAMKAGLGPSLASGGVGSAMGNLGKVALTAAAVYLVGNLATDIANQINEDNGQGGGWTTGDAAKAASPATMALLLGRVTSDALGWKNVSEEINKIYFSLSDNQDKILDLISIVLPAMKSNRLRTLESDAKAETSAPGANPETLQLFADYQAAVDERKAAEARHEQERTDLVNEQGAQRAALEGRFEARRTDIVQQFARQAFDAAAAFAKNEMRLEQDYYNQRQQAAQRFGVEAARMEADHQKEMRRMQEDHNLRVGELVSSRDALGLVKAQRDYEQNRRRAEEDYSTQAARRRQDYAQQMRDMEQSFAQQRARRAQDYQEQQAQREADQAARLAELEAQRVLELAEFEKTSRERMDLLRDQQRREMDTLKANESAREKLLTAIAIRGMTQTQYQAEQLFRTFNNRFNDWLNGTQRYGTSGGVIGPPKPPGYAAGGYVHKRGIYEMAENGRSEYVLDNPTTQAAERLMGQKITHQNLLQSLAAGGRNGSTVNLSFPGGLVSMPLLLDILDQREARLGDLIARAMEL